jgi:hypothetical protein
MHLETTATWEMEVTLDGHPDNPNVTGLYTTQHYGPRGFRAKRLINLLDGLDDAAKTVVRNNILNAFYDDARDALECERMESAA